jgi:hypothetical protein
MHTLKFFAAAAALVVLPPGLLLELLLELLLQPAASAMTANAATAPSLLYLGHGLYRMVVLSIELPCPSDAGYRLAGGVVSTAS